MSGSSALSRRRWFLLPVAVSVLALSVAAILLPGYALSDWLAGPPKYEGRTAREWDAALADPNVEVRQKAAFAIGCLNTSATGSVPKLAGLLQSDPDPAVRLAAAASLGKMAPATRTVIPELVGGLNDPERAVRMQCLIALSALKREAHPVLPALITAATDEENEVRIGQHLITVRQMALRTVGVVAEGTADGVPTLTAALEQQPVPDETRLIAVTGLGMAGRHAGEAAPLIRTLLTDPNRDVREAAGEALASVGASREGPTIPQEFDGLHLPDAEQKRLWAIEHAGNALNAYGFEPFANALRSADAAALTRLLTPDFTGSDLADPSRVSATGFADVVRLHDSGQTPRSLDRAGCVARLLELRRQFPGTPKVKLVVATIRPKDETRPDGVWEGKALLRLAGEHAPGAPAEVTATIRYEVTKHDEAGLAKGAWLKACHIAQVAVARSPRHLFVERAKARGLTADLHDNWKSESMYILTGGVFVTDYDRDGYLDVLVTDRTGNFLYRGGPDGKFTETTTQVGLPQAPLAHNTACWVDLDGDGWDDLILGQAIYRNEEGGRFTDVTEKSTLRVPRDVSNFVVADYDRDGKLDLYLARSGKPGNLSWLQGRSSDPVGNLLFRNQGGWKFEDVTKRSGTRGGYRSTFTAAWLDANNDGWPDLHVPNEFGDGVLLLNQKDGTFQPQALADVPADFGTMGLAVGDLNNDGNIDIYCADMYSKAGTRVIGNLKPDAYPPKVMEKFRRFVAGSQLHLNKGGGKFEQVGIEKQIAAVGWAYGPALADLDGDGFLDIYATAGYISRDRDKPDG